MKYAQRKEAGRVIILLLVVMIIVLMIGVKKGPVAIKFQDIILVLLGKVTFLKSYLAQPENPKTEVIIILIRLPRVLQGALVGGALALSGAVIQTLFRNPMADPFVIGISSGAALGASASILFGIGGFFTLPVMAFIGSSLAALIVYRLGKSVSGLTIDTLLLSGIAIAYFFSSITSFLLYSAGESLNQIIFWLMGGLWASSWSRITFLFPLLGISLIVLWTFSKDLNAMLLGEEPARHLGIDVESLKKIMLLISSLLASIAVAFAGTIGFVGLIVPHAARILFGPDHRMLLPTSALMGGIFLVLSDTIARSLIAPAEIPVGVITAFFGAPFFLYLLQSRRRRS